MCVCNIALFIVFIYVVYNLLQSDSCSNFFFVSYDSCWFTTVSLPCFISNLLNFDINSGMKAFRAVLPLVLARFCLCLLMLRTILCFPVFVRRPPVSPVCICVFVCLFAKVVAILEYAEELIN